MMRSKVISLTTMVLAAGSVLSCQDSRASMGEFSAQIQPTSRVAIPTNLHRRLVENSVAITSVTQPGIIFGLNDSGHDALLFAFDSTGMSRGIWRVSGARNLDWEAAAIGPCRAGTSTSDCIYIGDVGDNESRRSVVTIYRIPEPSVGPGPSDPRAQPAPGGIQAESIALQYSDAPHDVEAMYVTASGDLFLITKRRRLNASRRPRQALVYRVPAAAWSFSGTTIAALVDSLPIVPGDAPGRLVTDAALSRDGALVAVRTYTEVYTFLVDSATGRPAQGIRPAVCSILELNERQGEGIGWWWDGRRLVLTSEGSGAPLHVVECPLPTS
jgi:hypothetical protein